MKILQILCFLLPVTFSVAQINTKTDTISSGVIYKHISDFDDTLSISILKIDFTAGNYLIRSVKAGHKLNSRETTSSMVAAFKDSAYQVVAAINADFFEADGEVINNMISEGEFVKAVKFTDSPYNSFVNTQFAMTYDNKLLMEPFVYSGFIIFPDGTIEPVERINSRTDSNSVSLFNSYQGQSSPTASHNFRISEVTLEKISQITDTIFCIVSDNFQRGGNNLIPTQGFILSVSGRYVEYFERELIIGDTIKIINRINPHYNIRTLVGGWPLIVKDGMNVLIDNPGIEGVISRFSENRHPRTGIGFSKDSTKLFFITVDGRQSHSRGLSLSEFANLMINEGIYQGLNLDGGGSTVMVINDVIVNSPSDAIGERAVGNCLLLIREK